MIDSSDEAFSRWRLALVAIAGILGAGGVSTAAVAAHAVRSEALTMAALMLVVHAGLVVGVTAHAARAPFPRRWLVAASSALVGAGLFSGDVMLHTLQGSHLFPMAAPTGGSLLILSWLGVAGVALSDLMAGKR